MAIEMAGMMYLRTLEIGVPGTRSEKKLEGDLPNQPYNRKR